MKSGKIAVYLVLIIGLISVFTTPVQANGGDEIGQAVSYNPVVLSVVGVAVVVVAYVMYRILRGR